MRLKIRTFVNIISIYLFLFALLTENLSALIVPVVIYIVICIFTSYLMLRSGIKESNSTIVKFNQIGFLDRFGTQIGSFHFVFESEKNVIEEYKNRVELKLVQTIGGDPIQKIEATDIDRNLKPRNEKREFWLYSGPTTNRGTKLGLLFDLSQNIGMQSIRWWLVAKGAIDPNKKLWRYALAPLSVPFTIIPFLTKRYNPVEGVSQIDSGIFNSVDVLGRSREIQYVAFEELVKTLDKFEIDTSDLKSQKSNILNINVSGGQTSFGAVVQGALNKVTGNSGVPKQ
jgi:hypothetical protein